MLGKRKQLLLAWLFFLALFLPYQTFLGAISEKNFATETAHLPQELQKYVTIKDGKIRAMFNQSIGNVKPLQLYSSTINRLAFGVTRPDMQDDGECAASIRYSKTCDLALKWFHSKLLLSGSVLSPSNNPEVGVLLQGSKGTVEEVKEPFPICAVKTSAMDSGEYQHSIDFVATLSSGVSMKCFFEFVFDMKDYKLLADPSKVKSIRSRLKSMFLKVVVLLGGLSL